eukprot:scaffold84286_cov63-Phaeocystis_antarctica.AAC.2
MVKGDRIGDFGRRLGEAPGEASGPGLCAGARSAIVRKRESASSHSARWGQASCATAAAKGCYAACRARRSLVARSRSPHLAHFHGGNSTRHLPNAPPWATATRGAARATRGQGYTRTRRLLPAAPRPNSPVAGRAGSA